MADKSNNKKIVGFRKFSDIKTESKKIEEIDPSTPLDGFNDSDIPMNPNLPLDSKKIEKPASRKNLMPQDQDIELSDDDDDDDDFGFEEENEKKVETFGRVAKFPKNIKHLKLIISLRMLKYLRNQFGILWLRNKIMSFKWLNTTIKKVLIQVNSLMN